MKHLVLLISLTACGLNHVKVEPVTVQPIHITVDVNLHNDQAAPPHDKQPSPEPQPHDQPRKTARM
jgi:hypothetical protein